MSRGESPDTILQRARERGFTPARRDIAPLLDLLLGATRESDARAVEGALARRAELALPAALVRLAAAAAPDSGSGSSSARERARLLRLIGRVAGPGREAGHAARAALRDPDPRVRRQAALALARTGGAEDEDALLAAWDSEPELSARRALAHALGLVGGERALRKLRADLPGASDPELRRLLERAILTASRTLERLRPSAIDAGLAPPEPVPVVLRCRAGLERLLAAEVAAAGWKLDRIAAGQVETRLAGPLASLLQFRLHHGVAFPLPARRGPAVRAVVDALASPQAGQVFSSFTRGTVRFRIEWERGGHRRADVWRIAGEIARRRPDLVNDPTDSTWQVRVAEEGDTVLVALEPRKLDDTRFAYRVADVPAASHPTVAAALARLAVAHSPAPAGDVVWDPFAGSGLELCERGRMAPFRRLVGSDISEAAIAAARANLAAAGLAAVLMVADALDASAHQVPDLTVILTNPPMGRRVLRGRAPAVLTSLLERAAALLPAGGLLCWISPIPGQTRATAARLDLRLLEAHTVDMGGFAAEIQVLRAEPPGRRSNVKARAPRRRPARRRHPWRSRTA